jgi:hypothetical protein
VGEGASGQAGLRCGLGDGQVGVLEERARHRDLALAQGAGGLAARLGPARRRAGQARPAGQHLKERAERHGGALHPFVEREGERLDAVDEVAAAVGRAHRKRGARPQGEVAAGRVHHGPDERAALGNDRAGRPVVLEQALEAAGEVFVGDVRPAPAADDGHGGRLREVEVHGVARGKEAAVAHAKARARDGGAPEVQRAPDLVVRGPRVAHDRAQDDEVALRGGRRGRLGRGGREVCCGGRGAHRGPPARHGRNTCPCRGAKDSKITENMGKIHSRGRPRASGVAVFFTRRNMGEEGRAAAPRAGPQAVARAPESGTARAPGAQSSVLELIAARWGPSRVPLRCAPHRAFIPAAR